MPFARLTGSKGFDSELWPLDGQYVAAEGAAVSKQDGVWNLAVNALSTVFGLYPSGTNTHLEPGLHQMYDGRKVVVGWVAGTDNGTTALTDASPQEGGGNVVALIRKAGKGPPDGVYFNTQAVIIESEPVLVVEAVGGGGGYSTQKPLRMLTGSSPEWYSIESHGIKDLPGGRHRIVGMLVGGGEELDDPARPQIMLSNPLANRYFLAARGTLIGLDDPDGLFSMSADPLRNQPYVAVEGSLSPAGLRLSVDHFERIPTPPQ